MSKIAFIVSRSGVINLVMNGNTHTVPCGHYNHRLLLRHLRKPEQDANEIRRLMGLSSEEAVTEEIVQVIEPYSDGKITVNPETGLIRYGDEELPASLRDRMRDLMRDGYGSEGFKAFVKFCDRLMANPSKRSTEQAYKFVADNSLPITPEGFVLCYKAVRDDYTDKRSGKVDNHVGAKPFMSRNKVDDDPQDACSYGYHVGTKQFVEGFGDASDRYIVCKVDPADIVCVPHVDAGKVRVNTYEVIRDMEGRENFGVMEGGLYTAQGRKVEPTEVREGGQFDHDTADHWNLASDLSEPDYEEEEDPRPDCGEPAGDCYCDEADDYDDYDYEEDDDDFPY